jgi:hypothetical protein
VAADPLFRYMPLSAGRELFLPLGPAAATAGGLALYTPINAAARIYRGLIFCSIRLGLGPVLFKRRSLSGSAATEHLQEHRILALVQDALGFSNVEFAVYQGKEAIVRKPTILVLDRKGKPLAYAKVGWNAETRALVEREHQTLTLLAQHELRYGRVAPILGYLDLDHSKILLSAPLRHINAAPEFTLTSLHVAFLKEIGSVTCSRTRLTESTFWARANARMTRLREWLQPRQIDILESAMALLERRIGHESLPWILRLGDFLPWNFGVDPATNRIDVVDLEFAETDSLVGWDVFHFLIGIRPRFAPLHLAEHFASEAFQSYFKFFNVRPEIVPYLQLAYLIDITIFFRHMWQDQQLTPNATRNTQLRLEAISDVLAELAARPAAA